MAGGGGELGIGNSRLNKRETGSLWEARNEGCKQDSKDCGKQCIIFLLWKEHRGTIILIPTMFCLARFSKKFMISQLLVSVFLVLIYGCKIMAHSVLIHL